MFQKSGNYIKKYIYFKKFFSKIEKSISFIKLDKIKRDKLIQHDYRRVFERASYLYLF